MDWDFRSRRSSRCSTDRLLALRSCNRQLALYQEMLESARERHQIDNGEIEELLIALEGHRQLMEAAETIQRQIDELRDQLCAELGMAQFSASELRRVSIAHRQLAAPVTELLEVFDQLAAVLAQALEVNQRDTNQLRLRASRTARSMGKVRRGRRVSKAYEAGLCSAVISDKKR